MQHEVKYRPSYSLALVTLEPNETIVVEAGAMVSMSPGLTVETGARGGLLSAFKRSILGGESFFMNTYRAPGKGGQITLAPPLPGDIVVREMGGETFMVQSGSFIASSVGIEIDTKWSGARTFFASEGLIMLRASGTGTLFLSSYGAIHEIDLAAGQQYIVDTGHLVAFSEGMRFNVQRIGGIKSTLFSGEGLVVELEGPGKVFMQTRSQDAFLSWLIPRLPERRKRD